MTTPYFPSLFCVRFKTSIGEITVGIDEAEDFRQELAMTEAAIISEEVIEIVAKTEWQPKIDRARNVGRHGIEADWKAKGLGSDHELDGPKVLKSAAGFYIGYLYLDKEFDCWLPWSRESIYFATKEKANRIFNAQYRNSSGS